MNQPNRSGADKLQGFATPTPRTREQVLAKTVLAAVLLWIGVVRA